MLDKELLKRLDKGLEIDLLIIDELQGIRKELEIMNKRPIIELNKNELIDTFLTEKQDDIYEWYCDSYPECINSDTDYYDIPEDIIDDYIEDYFDEWLLKNYGIESDILN